MKVVGFKAFPVLNKKVITVGSIVSCLYDSAVTGGINGRAPRRGIVGAPMRSLRFVYGVESIRVKARTDASKIQRRFEKCFSHTDPFTVVIPRYVLAIGVSIGVDRAS